MNYIKTAIKFVIRFILDGLYLLTAGITTLSYWIEYKLNIHEGLVYRSGTVILDNEEICDAMADIVDDIL